MIILLSGISCSGKSTLSKQLLRDFEQPFVYHSFDFLVPSLLPHEDSFEAISMEGSIDVLSESKDTNSQYSIK